MRIFLDTANLEEIREAKGLGLLDGVTTNPSLIAKEGAKFETRIVEICEIVHGPVSAEVTSSGSEEMCRQGHELARLHENVIVKTPTTKQGLMAARQLIRDGIKINSTLCFSPSQALLVAKIGATYVSPFVGRLDDISHDGIEILRDIVTIYRNYGFKTQILAASIRHPIHVIEAAKAGADIATMPYKVYSQLFNHPLTEKGQIQFLADWQQVAELVR